MPDTPPNPPSPLTFSNLGAIPSAPDYRAAIIAAAIAAQSATPTPTLPPALFTDFQKLGGPLNQRQTPSCVSHAMAQLMKLWWYLKTGETVDFSPRFFHILSGHLQWNGAYDAAPDEGRDPTTVAKIAKNYGCATTATCPNDTTLPNDLYNDPRAITQTALDEAAKYKIPGFLAIPPTQFAVRQAIQTYGAVSLLFRVSAAFWSDKNGNVSWDQAAVDPVRAPKSPADVISGHELVGSGWNTSLDHFVNSWSDAWAEKGESDYLWNEWANYILEGIAIAEVPPSALALVQTLPPPDEFKHAFSQDIAYGSSGDEVRALQIALAIDGENVYPEITGYYGNATRQAVLAFQYKYNVSAAANLQALNGRNVGPKTRAALNKIFST
jgi:hypothetical protein